MKIQELLQEGPLGNAFAAGLTGNDADSGVTMKDVGKSMVGKAMGAVGLGKTANALGMKPGAAQNITQLAKQLGIQPNQMFKGLNKTVGDLRVDKIDNTTGVHFAPSPKTNGLPLTLDKDALTKLKKEQDVVQAKLQAQQAEKQALQAKSTGAQANDAAQSGSMQATAPGSQTQPARV
jgi:hypothetical protein